MKATYTALSDGELKVEISGKAGTEKLLIKVQNNEVSVEPFNGECELKFSHRQAMGALFALYVPEKNHLPAFTANWFPLPLNTFGSDNC
ncbi:MAG: hypothetical protein IKZ94_08995 [Lachnospiraceae bacterium]|nr:hypothetical protein [Lachnospiraceae bacterium]